MKNPFEEVKENVGGMFNDAEGSDCARGQAEAAAVLATPLVVAVSLVEAVFDHESKPHIAGGKGK